MSDDRLDLDGLWARYREACPDPDAGPDFMPGLWRKIEARRAFAFSVRRMAQAIITAAAIASFAMGFYATHLKPYPQTSYLEQLAAGSAPRDGLADSEIVRAALYEPPPSK